MLARSKRVWASAGVVLMLVGLSTAGELNNLSKQQMAQGWILLFDGERTFGWETHGDVQWNVTDGALVCDEGTFGWLGTKTEFTDFILKVDFRVSPGANSGVFFRSDKGKRPWLTGYEMEISEQLRDSPTGSIVGAASARPGVLKPGTWQSAVITAERDVLTVAVDGVKLVDTLSEKFRRGVIGLQYYKPGTKVEFRNIFLKPLGLKPIFNGKDLAGWNVLPGHNSVYSVLPGGALSVRNGRGDIQSEGQWADFCLQLDIICNGENLNSGVFFRAIPGQFWSGYESQVCNQWLGDDRTEPIDFGTGGIYGQQPAREVVSSDNEWFTKTIIAHGRHIAVWVDGYQVTDWTDGRPLNDNPRRGCRLKAGVIGLQGHDATTDVSFRNLRIAEYP